jgi:hypothetical protein
MTGHIAWQMVTDDWEDDILRHRTYWLVQLHAPAPALGAVKVARQQRLAGVSVQPLKPLWS